MYKCVSNPVGEMYGKTLDLMKRDFNNTMLDYGRAKEGVHSLYSKTDKMIDGLLGKLGIGTEHIAGYLGRKMAGSMNGFQPNPSGSNLGQQLMLAYASNAQTQNAVNPTRSYN